MTLKSKKLLLIFSGILIFLLGISLGFWVGKMKYASPKEEWRQDKNKISTTETEKTFVGEFKVVRVIDGDTIEIEGGERVRYIGIDTPETVDPKKSKECFGAEAFMQNKKLVAGKTVRLEKDTTDRDKYNRLLRYVWVGDDFINLDLVKNGFAYAYAYTPDTKYQKQISEAQKEAIGAKNGLWAACSAEAEKYLSDPRENIAR
jgi:micrococcal nuclease